MNQSKRIFLVGGNKGIGYSLLEQLLRQHPHPNLDLMFTVRSKEKGEQTISLLKKFISQNNLNKKCTQLEYFIMDVSNPQEIKDVSNLLKMRNSKIDLFINNAGIFIKNKPIGILEIKKTLDVNFWGPKKVFEDFLEDQIFAEDCKINFVSSQMGNFQKIAEHSEVLNQMLKYEDLSFTEKDLMQIINKYVEEIQNPVTSLKWSPCPYSMSKLFLTILISILSRKHSEFNFLSLCPGWCLTDMTMGSGAPKTADQGAGDMVKGILCYSEKEFSGKFVREGNLWNIIKSRQILL